MENNIKIKENNELIGWKLINIENKLEINLK